MHCVTVGHLHSLHILLSLTEISLYLGNYTRQGHSYYGTPIGTCM